MPSSDTQFKPGEVHNPNGRAVGSKNHTPQALAKMVYEAIEELGGKDWLIQLGKQKDGRAILGAMARMLLPRESSVKVDDKRGLAGEMRALADMSETELRQLAYTVDAKVIEVAEVEPVEVDVPPRSMAEYEAQAEPVAVAGPVDAEDASGRAAGKVVVPVPAPETGESGAIVAEAGADIAPGAIVSERADV